ncbi:MAG: hypothetical protein EKK37_13030 [Sphingobacteriales bacterium]|nr:MAG: hypothetical protein EKK37_13030 [Sphingobacteriales bacterium]
MRVYKLILVLFVFIFLDSPLFAQIVSGDGPGNPNAGPTINFGGDRTTTIGILLGNRIFPLETYSEVMGTPYFLDSFMNCVLTTKKGQKFAYDKMRLNLYTNQIHYLDKNNTELVVDEGVITRVVFLKKGVDTIAGFAFSNDYPSINKNSNSTYYLEMNSGKARILEQISKEVGYSSMVTGQVPKKEFKEHKEYFVFNENHSKMERWRKGKDFVIGFLNDKKEQVEKFINDNNLNCKSTDDVVKVFDYYNSLK